MPIDPITGARIGLTVANIAGFEIPGISSILGGGFGKHTSSAARQARLMASFGGTAGKKSAFDAERIQASLSGGTVLDSIQNIVTFKQRDDIFKQPHTAIITRGNFLGAFDIEHRTTQELIDNLKSKDLGGSSDFGGAGLFLSSNKTVLQGTLSIYNNLLKFNQDKAREFKTLAQNQPNVGNTVGSLFVDAFKPNFGISKDAPKGPPGGKSPIEIGDLARLALNFTGGAKPLRFRSGRAGGFTFAEQAKEQDLIIPPGFTSKQPTTLSRAIDPNILNGVR